MAFGIKRGVRFQILGDGDLNRIHWGTLHILEKVGVQVDSVACRKLLKDNGCEVDEKTRIARIPSHLVEEALAKKKASITLAGRNPKFDAKLDMNHSYMTANGNGAVTVDFESGKRRPSMKKDVANSSRIIDTLENVHIHWPMVSSTDQHPSTVHLHDFDASLNNTEKHVMYETGVTVSDARTLTEMGYAAAGGEKEYRRRPLSSCLQCTYAPLQHDAGVMDASLEFAKAGVPLVFFGMPQPGATGPATLVGSLVVGNAEVLSALTMIQLSTPGAAVIYGMGNAPLDMRTTIRAGGSPEHAISSAIATELAHHYGMPSCVGVSATAKEPGDQAVMEYYTGCVGPLLAGADLMCGVGLLEDSSCLFYEEIVIDDEIVGAIARLIRGEWADDETMALDVIEKVGPGKNFLAQRHTLTHMRTEFFMPNLVDRRSFDAWSQTGSKSMRDRAREKVKEILANHKVPPLDANAQKKLDAIIEKAKKPMWGGESKTH
ncbi:MAG: trimethylamine methyltransferase family protein [Thermoplasmatota archaeon]|nr:trimethylamine methyltransferase family protein [Candidatus Thermoplasmatota archaeon]MBU1915263.1 trimethylamine methyltransferase family protein [Candidatus Thermoplasmatota archaeon]